MMEIVITVLVVIIILLIIGIIVWKYYDKKFINKIKDNLLIHGSLHQENDYFLYEVNDKTYALYILRVNHNLKLTFNSNKIWEKSSNGNMKLINMTHFSNLKYDKIVVIYPKNGPYLYYQDENNLMFTTPFKNIWDIRVISYDLIDEIIPNLNK